VVAERVIMVRVDAMTFPLEAVDMDDLKARNQRAVTPEGGHWLCLGAHA
jgi:hypothetical protein